jgi:hypothetical protein
MGEQEPFGLTDTFARNLADGYRSDDREVRLSHRVEPSDGSGSPASYVRMTITRKEGAETAKDVDRIDLHEVYWADKPQGLIRLKGVGKWLWATSMTPLRRWPQNASLFHNPTRPRSSWEKAWDFVREVLLALVLPILGIGLLVFTLNAAGLADGYVRTVRENLRDASLSGWVYLGGVAFAVTLVAGLFLLLGAGRISRTVNYEKMLIGGQTSDTAPADRWSWMRGWSAASAFAGIASLIVASVLYETQADQLVLIVLRLGDESFARVVWAVIWLAMTVGVGGGMIVALWSLPWRGWRRVARVLGAVVVAVAVFVALVLLVDEFDQAAKLVLWGTGLVGAAVLSWFLVRSIGDVAIYFDGINERSRHHATRQDIIGQATRKLTTLLRTGSEVYVAAHSLGSVIAYDAINRLATAQRAGVDGTGNAQLTEDEKQLTKNDFDRLRGFYSFGSPLDKVVYLFHKTTSSRSPVLSQIHSSLTSFKRRSSKRPYGPYEFAKYEIQVPNGFRWRNAWSWGDVLGHRLDFYELVAGDADEETWRKSQPHFDYIPLVAHTAYWKDPDFYADVREFVEDPT